MQSLNSIILITLTSVEEGKSVKNSLRYYVSHYDLNREDESTLYYYVYEIYRRLNLIDLYIKKSSSNYSLKKFDNRTKSFLRLATFMMKIEKKSKTEIIAGLSSFYDSISDFKIEKILDLIDSVAEETLYENRTDLASKLSIEKYIPTWMVRNFFKKWEENFVISLLNSLLENLPVYVRINTLKTDSKMILDAFQDQGVIFEPVKEIENLFKIINSDVPIPRLREFDEGQIIIQQKASALVTLVLNPKIDEKILDMCASPGSKTSHIAALVGTGKNITALDINADRIRILKQRLKLLGVEDVKIKHYDAKLFHTISKEKYDKILLDPPCSGSGTYASRPENKWRLKQRDLRWYTTLQYDLLNSAAKLVRTGGNIVYSTCSLFDEENQDIISLFLEENKHFKLEESRPIIGHTSAKLENKAQEFYPHIHYTEGFFIAKLKKIT